MAGKKTSVYLTEDILKAVEASGLSPAQLVKYALDCLNDPDKALPTMRRALAMFTRLTDLSEQGWTMTPAADMDLVAGGDSATAAVAHQQEQARSSDNGETQGEWHESPSSHGGFDYPAEESEARHAGGL